MKKNIVTTILLFVLIWVSTSLYGQNIREEIKPVEFSIGAGMVALGHSIDGANASFDSRLGYGFYFKTDFNFENNWYIQTGLSFINNSFKHRDVQIEDLTSDTNANILNISIPLHLGYKFRLNSTKFTVGAGPYIMHAVSGTDEKIRAFREYDDYIGTSTQYKVFDYLKKTDIGIGLRFGAELRHLVISIDYNYGLTNISKIEGTTIKNSFALIGIAYKF